MTHRHIPDDDVHTLFERTLSSMGSQRLENYRQLRHSERLRDFDAYLNYVDGLDKESTTFEAALRDLQKRAERAGGTSDPDE